MTASLLPPPRNIRRTWKPREIGLLEAAAEMAIRFKFMDRYGTPIEARAWERRMGWRKGWLTRVDVAFHDHDSRVRFASLRLSGRASTIHLGELAAV